MICLLFLSVPFSSLLTKKKKARCMAARTPKIATWGNILAAALTFIVGITFSYMGGYTRLHYGPDSQFASFTVSAVFFFVILLLSVYIYIYDWCRLPLSVVLCSCFFSFSSIDSMRKNRNFYFLLYACDGRILSSIDSSSVFCRRKRKNTTTWLATPFEHFEHVQERTHIHYDITYVCIW